MMEKLKKIFTDLISLAIFNGLVIWLAIHFNIILANGAYSYVVFAAGGLILVITGNILAVLGIGFFRYQYYRSC